MKKILLIMLGSCVQLTVMAQAVITHTTVTHHKHAVVHHKSSPDVKWKHSNTATTVAKDNHAAYEGKPSQANDGVNKNKQRNINANTPTQLAPVNGNGAK